MNQQEKQTWGNVINFPSQILKYWHTFFLRLTEKMSGRTMKTLTNLTFIKMLQAIIFGPNSSKETPTNITCCSVIRI